MGLRSNVSDSLARVKVVSRADSVVLMVIAFAVALVTTGFTVVSIIGNSGEVVLRLPVDPALQEMRDLGFGAAGRTSQVEVTMPRLPENEAALLGWSAVFNQVAILAVASLLVLLAHRLANAVLFARGTAVVLGIAGGVLAIAGSAGQIMDSTARNRLAEYVGLAPATPGETLLYVSGFNPTPLVAGIALLLFAGVFQFGRRLQRDVEGLV
ncbi:hypothetical protein ACPFL9_02245 [Paenarthrobacter sp. NyZ202]|uniref:hypothetical protein n=1 Tax=Paenarthrobacter sp. NyZ202 TaxID=3402689 RepID=UPI003CEFB069